MSWFREWLRGPEAAEPTPARPARTTSSPARPGSSPDGAPPEGAPPASPGPSYPGERFGLPEQGPDSVATLPLRGAQFALDLIVGGVVAAAIHFPAPWWLSTLVWIALVYPTVALLGQTPTMMLLGLRVARVDGATRVGPVWAGARTLSLLFVVPGLILDRDARGLQDRVSRTIVLRTR